jgi:predicted CXXCH cytochrome family protein
MARAQGIFEKLVMPGPLIGAHAELEKTCKSCHEPFAQQSQSGLCMACHKPIAADRQAKRNYHGRHPEVLKGECKSCHTEHKGRTFDLVQLNRETFNHAFANFTLTGLTNAQAATVAM